jgi:hypothetical protein
VLDPRRFNLLLGVIFFDKVPVVATQSLLLCGSPAEQICTTRARLSPLFFFGNRIADGAQSFRRNLREIQIDQPTKTEWGLPHDDFLLLLQTLDYIRGKSFGPQAIPD